MTKPKSKRSRFGRILLVLFFLSLPSGMFAFYWLVTLPDVAVLAKTNPYSTALIRSRVAEASRQGKAVRPRQRWVPLSHISPFLRRAVIVGEDASFYSHEGFDWKGIKNAAISNIRSGKLRRGGSTITQQLAKNLYLSSNKTLARKMHEAMIARTIEHRLTKKRILEIYLNIVEWGHHVYGAEAAALHHFGKSALELTREEAALLAAMLPSPREYDPLHINENLRKRQLHILEYMK